MFAAGNRFADQVDQQFAVNDQRHPSAQRVDVGLGGFSIMSLDDAAAVQLEDQARRTKTDAVTVVQDADVGAALLVAGDKIVEGCR